MRLLLLLLLLILSLIQMKLWFGEGGVTDINRLKERVQQQAEENAQLELRNAALQAEVEDLREGLDAVEELARSQLGLIKEGEEFYQTVPPPDDH